MTLTATAAKALTTIILRSTVGGQFLDNYLPLRVTSDGAAWNVHARGDDPAQVERGFRIVIDKTTAEVLHFGKRAAYEPPPDLKAVIEAMNQRPEFGGGKPSVEPPPLAFVRMMFGGVINKPEDAIAYARVLIRARPDLAKVPARELRVKHHAGVWHVTREIVGRPTTKVMKFCATDGKDLVVA